MILREVNQEGPLLVSIETECAERDLSRHRWHLQLVCDFHFRVRFVDRGRVWVMEQCLGGYVQVPRRKNSNGSSTTVAAISQSDKSKGEFLSIQTASRVGCFPPSRSKNSIGRTICQYGSRCPLNRIHGAFLTTRPGTLAARSCENAWMDGRLLWID